MILCHPLLFLPKILCHALLFLPKDCHTEQLLSPSIVSLYTYHHHHHDHT
ncbi:hypothetical protein KP509_1Z216300 [Ceratopteris richardii]|nr:hypothetical protein KP509_1Z216300 [Ceratopteris richardii]